MINVNIYKVLLADLHRCHRRFLWEAGIRQNPARLLTTLQIVVSELWH